jgi:hypothetical protein
MGGARMMGDIITKYYNNSLENIGEADSFVWYGMYCEKRPSELPN